LAQVDEEAEPPFGSGLQVPGLIVEAGGERERRGGEAREGGQRERETAGYEPFARYAPTQ